MQSLKSRRSFAVQQAFSRQCQVNLKSKQNTFRIFQLESSGGGQGKSVTKELRSVVEISEDRIGLGSAVCFGASLIGFLFGASVGSSHESGGCCGEGETQVSKCAKPGAPAFVACTGCGDGYFVVTLKPTFPPVAGV